MKWFTALLVSRHALKGYPMRRSLITFILSFCTLVCINASAQEKPVTPVLPDAAAAPIPVDAAPAATTAPATAVRIPDLSGDWCGSWVSCVNGHKGPMRASFCRQCDGNYKVTFTGRFCKLIPFRYSTVLNVTGYTDGVVYMSGSQYLGPIFGTFSYNAWANDRQFASGYNAGSKDQGQFTLSR